MEELELDFNTLELEIDQYLETANLDIEPKIEVFDKIDEYEFGFVNTDIVIDLTNDSPSSSQAETNPNEHIEMNIDLISESNSDSHQINSYLASSEVDRCLEAAIFGNKVESAFFNSVDQH